MTDFGAISSAVQAGALADSGYDEATAVSTTSATLEDVTGLSLTVDVPTGYTGKVMASMAVQCSTTGGAPATGGWAININAVDGTEIQRYLSGTNDTGALMVAAQQTGLSAGTYTVKARHRRVSGTSTVNTDVGQLMAWAILE